MPAITVENIYSLKIDGSRVDLEFVTPGGIAAINVTTEQFEPRLFPIEGDLSFNAFESNVDPDHDPFRSVARDICVYAATGRHPSDNIKPEARKFAGLGLMRASDLIREMHKKETQKIW